jgi:GMP synthase (glutamine-hydrolysing)
VRVLSLTHGPTVGGGVFDATAARAGHRLEGWAVPLGGEPEPPERYDAIMAFGGGMHPDEDDRHPWLEREVEYLRRALAAGVPLFGVCLGAQLIARAAGAAVGPAPAAEIGWLPVELTAEGRADPVLGVLPERFEALQWHSYTYAVAQGGAELARSPVCTQAFRLGERAWGTQFHPEATGTMVEAWIAEEADGLPLSADALRRETAGRLAGWNSLGRSLAAAFLRRAAELRTAGTGVSASRMRRGSRAGWR